MAWTIIVASSQGDQLDALIEGAQTIAEAIGQATILTAASVEEVHKRRKFSAKNDQLLIVAVSLLSAASGAGAGATPGLDLVRSVASEAAAPRFILVSDDMKHFLAVQDVPDCEVLFVDCSTDYVRNCLQLARRLGVIKAGAAPGAARDRAIPDASPAVRTVPSPPLADDVPVEPPGNSGRAAAPPAGSIAPYVVVEVHLRSNNTRSGFVTIDGRNPEPLELDASAVDEVIRESQALAQRLDQARESADHWRLYSPLWSGEYQRLGEMVGKLLWPTAFSQIYWTAHGRSNGNVRLRFNLDQLYFDGAWEAIYDHLNNDFLMLASEHTVARRANYRRRPRMATAGTSSGQIEVEDGVLKMIVIQSNVTRNSIPAGPKDPLWEEYWKSLNSTLAELPHIEKEVKMLKGLAHPRGGRRTASGLSKIEIEVLAARPGRPLADLVERRLKDRSRPYDIVHFAGHALFLRSPIRQDSRGYLVFSGSPGERPEAVPIATVADWLENSGVQLVYLSCCRSSAAAAALELAGSDVPLTIGFNWNLDDGKAVDFARDFYGELLNDARLKVCVAFNRARRSLHGYFAGGDPIWAAPVLIAQPEDWSSVEGVLRPVPPLQSGPRPTKRATAARKAGPRTDPGTPSESSAAA
jgi:hypothetical protein